MGSESDPIMERRQHPSATPFRWSFRLRRRQRLPSVRLGGKRPRRGLFLLRVLKKAKLKWLKLKYMCILKQIKKYYKSFVNDMIEGSGTIESFQQRLLLETSFAVPVMGISFNAYPSTYQRW